MGCFSYITADTERSISIRYSVSGTFPVAVLIPEEFGGGAIIENYYEGYGEFGGYDIFEMIATWNRKYLTTDNLEKPVREDYSEGEEGENYYKRAVGNYLFYCDLISDFKNGMTERMLAKKYGDEWKRDLGIAVASYDEQMGKLNYPLKIVEDFSLKYKDVEVFSKRCPYQGCC